MTFLELVQLISEGSAKRSYSCLMLDCSELYNQIEDHIQSKISSCDVYDAEPGHGLESDIHITALYGIHTSQFADVLNVVDIKPCKYTITDISMFTNDKFDVLKFGVSSRDLTRLNKQCREELEYTSSYPDYKPHITIGYLKPGTGKKYTKMKCSLVGKTFESDMFVFSDKNSDKVYHRAQLLNN